MFTICPIGELNLVQCLFNVTLVVPLVSFLYRHQTFLTFSSRKWKSWKSAHPPLVYCKNWNVFLISLNYHFETQSETIDTFPKCQKCLMFSCIKERVFMIETQSNDSCQKCGSFEGGTPGGQMWKTHTKLIVFLAFSLYSHQFWPVESF